MTYVPAYLVKWFWLPPPAEGPWKNTPVWVMHKHVEAFPDCDVWWTIDFDWIKTWGWDW